MTLHTEVLAREVTPRQTLVVALSGLADAGSAVTQFYQVAMSGKTKPVPLVEFDSDGFFLYASRRPVATMRAGKIESVAFPGMTLVQCADPAGQPYLLLAGMEPDMGWLEIARLLGQLVDDWDISTIVSLAAVPWNVPHTRPTVVGAHASNPLVSARFPLLAGDAVFPASFSSALEALKPSGTDVATLVAYVPQYLAGAPSSAATNALSQAVKSLCGIEAFAPLPKDEDLESLLDLRMRQFPPLRELVASLEMVHESQLAARDTTLSSGDDLVSQIEAFLDGLDSSSGRDFS